MMRAIPIMIAISTPNGRVNAPPISSVLAPESEKVLQSEMKCLLLQKELLLVLSVVASSIQNCTVMCTFLVNNFPIVQGRKRRS